MPLRHRAELLVTGARVRGHAGARLCTVDPARRCALCLSLLSQEPRADCGRRSTALAVEGSHHASLGTAGTAGNISGCQLRLYASRAGDRDRLDVGDVVRRAPFAYAGLVAATQCS